MLRILVVLLLFAAAPPVGAGSSPSLSAASALVYDPADGRILFERNADRPRPPASTTKLLTALIASEALDPDARLRVSARAAGMPRTKADLRAGSRYRAGDLLKALLVGSSNDAAVVLAEGVSGSEAAFAARMTARARALGCRNTRFVNASGLSHADQVSSCRDLLRIYAEVRRSPRLMAILRMSSTTLAHPGGGQTSMRNHNKLLGDYAAAPVGKTGYTRSARHCFAGSFVRQGRELFVACMGSRSLWGDLQSLTLGRTSTTSVPAPAPASSPDQVRTLQAALAKLGYSPGPVDGVQGARTREALKRFQKDRGLLADGTLKDASRAALERESGIKIP